MNLNFFLIFLHPSAIQGPAVVLKMRNYMKACSVSLPAKKCFIAQKEKPLNPTTAALGVLYENIDVSKISTAEKALTKTLLWSNRPLAAFLCNFCSFTMPDNWAKRRLGNVLK